MYYQTGKGEKAIESFSEAVGIQLKVTLAFGL